MWPPPTARLRPSAGSRSANCDGWLYQQISQSYTGHVLVQQLGDDTAALAAGCHATGGIPLEVGDCGFAFRVLPAVTLAVVYWRGDDEFAPEAAHPLWRSRAHYLSTDELAIWAVTWSVKFWPHKGAVRS
ncbi:MAG: DUF3786 domain-containing protein [Caldilineaceae bacterium]